jgi:hypothetical protein
MHVKPFPVILSKLKVLKVLTAVLENKCYRMAATRYEKQGYIY